MKPGRFEKSARFVLYLPSTNNQKSWFSRKFMGIDLNVNEREGLKRSEFVLLLVF